MASISKHKEMWRAQVFKCGQRKSKVFPTKEKAEKWADDMEAKLQALSDRFNGISASPGIPLSAPVAVLRALSKVPHSRGEILLSSVPHIVNSGVYFLLRGTEIVYIGQAVDVLYRISRHRREGRVFDAFSYITCEEDGLDELESLYIRALVPEDNWTFGNRTVSRKYPNRALSAGLRRSL